MRPERPGKAVGYREPEDRESRYSRARLVATLAVLVLLTETAPLELSLVYPAVRSMAAEFGPDHIDKAITAVNLAAVVSIPLVGRLADVVGKKRVLLGCSAVFGVGSLVCALAPTFPVLLLGRVLQGSVGGILAVAYALIRDVFPRSAVPVALGVVSTGIGISGLVAPFLGGALVDSFGFRGVFWFLLALVLVLLPLAAVVVPESPIRQRRRLDAAGALLLGLGAATLLVGIGLGARSGWLSGVVIGSLAGGAVLLAGFVARERATPEPAVDLRVLTSPALRTTLMASFFGASLIGPLGYLLPQMLQTPPHSAITYGVGLTALATAGWVFPQGLMSMAGGPLGGLLARRRSPRLGLLIALVLLCAAMLMLAQLPSARWQVLALTTFSGLGVGLFFVSVTNLVNEAVPDEQSGAGNGLMAACNQLGAATGVTVLSSILAAHTVPAPDTSALYADSGYALTYLTAAGLGAVALVIAFAMRHGRTPAGGSRAPLPSHPAPPTGHRPCPNG